MQLSQQVITYIKGDLTSLMPEKLLHGSNFSNSKNFPKISKKYYKWEKLYPPKNGTITAYYICCRSQSTSKCSSSIHLVYNPKTKATNTIISRPHVPHCEQLVLKPERTSVVKDAKIEMSLLAQDMASSANLSSREIAKAVIKQTWDFSRQRNVGKILGNTSATLG